MDFQFNLLLAIFFIAFLYSMVGHGGASSYIAVMVLFSVPVHDIKISALILNILVAGTAFYSFFRAGHFRINLLWPFVLISIPFAYLGGRIDVHPALLKILVGVCLLFVALQIFLRRNQRDSESSFPVPYKIALPVGATIGFISGLIGIGGGIFLSPLLLMFKWAHAKTAAAVSAAFILLNSLSGLAAQLNHLVQLNFSIVAYAIVALLGGYVGSQIGSKAFSPYKLKFALTVILVMASYKLIISA